MQHHAVAAFAIAASLATTACHVDVGGEEVVLHEEKRFPASGATELTLRTFDGSIEVRSWDRNEVLVEIERRASNPTDARALEVRVNQDGTRIVIEAPEPRDGGRDAVFGSWHSPAVHLIVTAPRQRDGAARPFTLLARTGDGGIWAHDLTGRIELQTGDGDIRAENVEGELKAHTGDGSIQIVEAQGRFDLGSGDGNIEVEGLVEALRVRTGDGGVHVNARPGSELKSDWTITTGDGAVMLRLPDGLDAEVDARSGDGRVLVEGLTGITAERDDSSPERHEESRSVRGRLGNGGRLLRIQSGDGQIEITTR